MCDSCGCGMKAETINVGMLFGSQENEESMSHEMTETRGSMGEDID